MLSDILPTAYEVGVLNGQVSPGDTVAVVGAGPIGLSAIAGATLYSPSHIIAIDLADARLEAAKRFGADLTLNNGTEDAVTFVREITDGLGADVVIEAVGVPATFELCTELVRPGGRVANIGVHGTPAQLQIDAASFATHRFGLDQMVEAYDVFARAADTGAIKVIISRAATA
jgi:alcohol dehydrogenase